MRQKTYIGIDPGLSGGIAIIDGLGRAEMQCCPMPVCLHGRRRTVDVAVVREILAAHADPSSTMVIIESAMKFSAGTNALTSTWFGFGRLTAMLELDGWPHEIIASPLTWQKMFWSKPHMPKGTKFDTKAASIAAAKRLWPDHSFLPTSRCTKPSDGLTDAALIAEYGRRNQL